MERLGTAWFGTIFELDGVCIEYECGDGGRSWQALAAEEGKSVPPLWALKKARGMKNEQVGFPAHAFRPAPWAANLGVPRRLPLLPRLVMMVYEGWLRVLPAPFLPAPSTCHVEGRHVARSAPLPPPSC